MISTTRMPSVSIGLPVYNGEKFLPQALDSLLVQTFKDFELIISDNASTDGTEEICLSYTARDRRIRYFRNEKNLGIVKNFNRVFELSSGAYFKWHSADDLCAPDLLEKCKAILDRHPEVVLCYPKTQIIDERGAVIRQYDDGLDLRFPSVSDRFHQLISKLGLCNVQYGLIRSSILRRTKLFGNYIASDIVFLAELALHGQFFEISEYLFFRRFHPRASSSITTLEKVQEFYDPKSVGQIFLREWRHLFEYLRVIQRASLDLTEKIALDFQVLKMARWKRKQLVAEFTNALQILAYRLVSACKKRLAISYPLDAKT